MKTTYITVGASALLTAIAGLLLGGSALPPIGYIGLAAMLSIPTSLLLRRWIGRKWLVAILSMASSLIVALSLLFYGKYPDPDAVCAAVFDQPVKIDGAQAVRGWYDGPVTVLLGRAIVPPSMMDIIPDGAQLRDLTELANSIKSAGALTDDRSIAVGFLGAAALVEPATVQIAQWPQLFESKWTLSEGNEGSRTVRVLWTRERPDFVLVIEEQP